MCIYEYYHSEVCGHLTIEITSYCARTRWSAGFTGTLRPCAEQTYSKVYAAHFIEPAGQALELTPYVWKGQSASCRQCVEAYMVSYCTHSVVFLIAWTVLEALPLHFHCGYLAPVRSC